jgi:small-conductance mechanosensitive channel
MTKRSKLPWMRACLFSLIFSPVWMVARATSSQGEEAPLPLPTATDAAPLAPRTAQLADPVEGDVAPATALQDLEKGAAESQPSEAERLSRLQRSLEADGKRLAELKESLANPESEYAKAEADFRHFDVSLEQKRKQLEKLGDSAPEEAARLASEIEAVERSWKLAKQRFDLAILERKTLQENAATLEQKLQKDKEALDKLQGNVGAPAVVAAPATPQDAPPGNSAAPSPSQPASSSPPAAPPPASDAQAKTPTESKGTAAPPPSLPASSLPASSLPTASLAPVAAPATGAPGNSGDSSPAPQASDKPPSKELVAASAAAEQSENVAQAAEEVANSLSERIEILRKNIDLERKLRDMARQKVDHAEQLLRDRNEELERLSLLGEPTAEVRRQEREALLRMREARRESLRLATHLDELQTELGKLQADQVAALREADSKRLAAETDRRKVASLQNPFAAHNLLQWMLSHGAAVALILLSVVAIVWLLSVSETRLMRLIVARARRGGREERENRARTLIGVFRNAGNVITVGGGGVMVLDEIGLPVAPLLGGAAVLGLAVAFGAQSLIKDYFTGFMLLLEQQYMINDVIKIGEISGQVERISLRMTVLRDLEGRVHFVPHGQITAVTNMTHGWSRAVFDIGVAYRENIDQVIDVLLGLAADLRQDPQYACLILEEPTMLGVDALGDSSVSIKFHLKTRPLQQWTVKRELLRRIKNRFDELGIEIPFPHRTIFHRSLPATEEGEARWAEDRAA